jgi:uncharacterized protein (TIGR03083 family)
MVAAAMSYTNTSTSAPTDIRQAEDIPAVTPQEASEIATFELTQVLNLLEQLEGDDWAQPTECTEWNVQRMTAHLAGGCAGWATWRDFRRQIIFNPYMRTTDVPVDAINRREVEDREGMTPRQLIDELHRVGPKAVRTRRNLPGILRSIRIDAKPMPGKMSMAYLVDVVYPRDQWMHRMDICRATGKTWVANPDHDRRLLDLIMLDVAKTLAGRLAIVVNITGALTTSYRFGTGEPEAEIDMDFIEFNRRSSLRTTTDEAMQITTVRGSEAVARDFVENCLVLY